MRTNTTTPAERLAGWASLLAVALLLLALVVLAGGCAPTKPKPDERANSSVLAPPVKLDTVPALVNKPASVARPGILSHVGTVFSTPAGIERRHARRLARASVPRRLAKGAVYAPQATQVAAGFKNRAAVVSADSGSTVTAIEKVKAPVAIGPGATATQTNPVTGLSPWWLLLLLIPAGWLARKLFIPYA